HWFGVSSDFILSGTLDKNRNLLYLGSQDKGLFQVRLDEMIVYEEYDEAEVKGIAGSAEKLGLLSNLGLEIRDSQVLNGELIDRNSKRFKRISTEISLPKSRNT